ncbi:MAG TPA: flagellar basal-body MS-ring/collar protein FliF [Steroidobacteraceae bacterium]|jgi:flagellar M-ring protein FliF|nr:flagellar basal-body MS-ring/collar protein FliF [Steroidobacteraceae bacterium]
MATNSATAFANGLGLNLRPLLLLLGIAGAVAVGVTVVMWWKGPDWSLLYGSLSDADESSVVQALQTAGIQYKLDDANGAVMVPAERVHDARLQLAAQGLPAGKTDGFALISKDPGFGVSQFMENARYQYALESELQQTIASLQAVQAARVQLALPQQSAFISDRRPASASVLLQLRAGRRLAPEQVSAIVHLVASSVPELDADNVTVVDQEGRLLSSPKSGDAAVASAQFDAEHRIEDSYSQHIEELLTPLVGPGRVSAQVTVDLDSDATEQASEQYQPNSAVVRSEQTSEQVSVPGSGSGGVPGALTNQPPAGGTIAPAAKPAARAPAAAAVAGAAAVATGATAAGTAADTSSASSTAGAVPEDTSKQSTRNYEIDRTVSYSRQPAGRIKRLTVAVLVDNVRQTGKDGKVTQRPLSQAELDNITRLVKDSVGFDQARGDSVNVVNEPFLEQTEVLAPVVVPLWQRPWVQGAARLVLGALVLVALALGVLRPLIKNLASHAVGQPVTAQIGVDATGSSDGAGGGTDAGTHPPGHQLAYEQQIVQARNLVTQDPKRVAQVVKTWVAEQ